MLPLILFCVISYLLPGMLSRLFTVFGNDFIGIFITIVLSAVTTSLWRFSASAFTKFTAKCRQSVRVSMKQLLEFIPLILLFWSYKMSGIQMASIAMGYRYNRANDRLKNASTAKLKTANYYMGGSVVFFRLTECLF